MAWVLTHPERHESLMTNETMKLPRWKVGEGNHALHCYVRVMGPSGRFRHVVLTCRRCVETFSCYGEWRAFAPLTANGMVCYLLKQLELVSSCCRFDGKATPLQHRRWVRAIKPSIGIVRLVEPRRRFRTCPLDVLKVCQHLRLLRETSVRR